MRLHRIGEPTRARNPGTKPYSPPRVTPNRAGPEVADEKGASAGINAMIKFSEMDASLFEVHGELGNLAGLALLYGTLALWRHRHEATM